jgi:hypothetical protein
MEKRKRVIIEPTASVRIPPDRMRAVIRSVHVVPEDVGWVVKKGGRSRMEVHFAKKSDAVRYGQELSREARTGLYVHFKNGNVQEMNTRGTDSNMPNGHVDS